ncbi:MAG: S-adenosylmethionine decarboxylase family protein [Undibacterium sp.]
MVDEVSHEFPGGGETFVYVLSESHLALHTYPEHKYISIDLYTCGSCDPSDLRDVLLEKMDAWGISVIQHGEVIRGVPAGE